MSKFTDEEVLMIIADNIKLAKEVLYEAEGTKVNSGVNSHDLREGVARIYAALSNNDLDIWDRDDDGKIIFSKSFLALAKAKKDVASELTYINIKQKHLSTTKEKE